MVRGYFHHYAMLFHKTIEKYLDEANYNYVIVADGQPLCFSDGLPVIYGCEEGADEDSRPGDEIITEREMLERFCPEELAEATGGERKL